MSKRKRTNNKKGSNNETNSSYTKQELIEMLAQAHFEAMKLFEKEKELKEQALEKQALKKERKQSSKQARKRTKGEIIKNIFQFFFFPSKAYDNFKGINIADDLLSSFVSLIWALVGHALRIIATILTVGTLYLFFRDSLHRDFGDILATFFLISLEVIAFLFGNLFIFASKDLEKEKDKNYIMSHASMFFAILAIVITIILATK